MIDGTFANTHRVGRRIVPFVTGQTEQNRLDRQRLGEPAHEKGAYRAYRAYRALEFGQPTPMTASKTSCFEAGPAPTARKRDTHPGKMIN
jgi:hypothetical protein